MMNSRILRRRIFVLLTVVGLLSALGGAVNGKGKPPKDDPPPPPILYDVTWLGTLPGFDETSASDINDAGIVVGRCQDALGELRAYVYTPGPVPGNGSMDDLNDPQALRIDLDDPLQPVANWTAITASGVDEAGRIVGTARHLDGRLRAYLFDPHDPATLGPLFQLTPALGDGDHSGRGINDLGDVVGYWRNETDGTSIGFLYTSDGSLIDLVNDLGAPTGWAMSVNNAGHILVNGSGIGARYTPSESRWVIVEGFSDVWDMNEAGAFVGRWQWNNRDYASRYSDLAGLQNLYESRSIDIAGSINTSGDVTLRGKAYRGFLYRESENAVLALDDLVVAPDPADLVDWLAQSPLTASRLTIAI